MHVIKSNQICTKKEVMVEFCELDDDSLTILINNLSQQDMLALSSTCKHLRQFVSHNIYNRILHVTKCATDEIIYHMIK